MADVLNEKQRLQQQTEGLVTHTTGPRYAHNNHQSP